MVQKNTGSGTSTPERTTLGCSPCFFLAMPSLWARQAAAAAEALDDTMVSPVTVLKENHKSGITCLKAKQICRVMLSALPASAPL